MDEDQSPPGEGMSSTEQNAATSRSPEEIRAEIEQTRAELGDTVAAFAEKTDVAGQAKRAAQTAKKTAGAKIADVKDSVTSKASDVSHAAQQATPESAADAGRQATTLARQNRTAVIAAGAFGLGMLIGRRR